MAITRLWFFTLRPNTSFDDPAFFQLWTDVLELCATYTPAPGPSSSQAHVAHLSQPRPKRAHHFLFQSAASTDRPSQEQDSGSMFVLISSYPSFALCTQADTAYANRYHSQISEHVRHRALRQLDMEDAEAVPALLSSTRTKGADGSIGGKDESGPTVTVAISNQDPLIVEALSCSSGKKTAVPPPDEEISGADVYALPPVPIKPPGNLDGQLDDLFESQRGEGRKWIRISRGIRAGDEDMEMEVFKLKELLSR
ncbi:hypothetical protein N0V93_009609 [Gnomoniopsis smithogilvyi]|uniref:Uncharacterized protein n=1 Tax=Gnomoniopsis smithogilvyi TaxID=1191159 RepID=A0A9W9CSY9_9PEZI|nr:hypothetical protein N0V93_009609 [Gnomoniopsis smithogilvyi]